MVAGLMLGLAMGISDNFSLSSVHAHILLLGWETMAITGIAYMLAPACSQSRLANLHFWGHNLGLPVMMADDPLTAVVMGAGKALDEISLLREVAVH